MITILDLNKISTVYPLLSQDLIDDITQTLKSEKRVLVFLNKRWESGALFCKDCWFVTKCPECDTTLSIHKYPENALICHECWYKEALKNLCPKCSWANLIHIWSWTQKVEDALIKVFPDKKIVRLDSDKLKKEWIWIEDIKNADIIVATQAINSVSIENLWLIALPLFEIWLLANEYDAEEKLYENIMINLKRQADVVVQTFYPWSKLLEIISKWNYKDFLNYTLGERKEFSYPPYVDMANIIAEHTSKDNLVNIMSSLKNKLDICDENKEFEINYSKDLFTKKNWRFRQKITLRWKNLRAFLECISFEIFRNRNLKIEWSN